MNLISKEVTMSLGVQSIQQSQAVNFKSALRSNNVLGKVSENIVSDKKPSAKDSMQFWASVAGWALLVGFAIYGITSGIVRSIKDRNAQAVEKPAVDNTSENAVDFKS